MSGAIQQLPNGGPNPVRDGLAFWPLAAAGCAILAAFVAAAIGGSPTQMPPSHVQATRMLRFDDSGTGAVQVTDAQTGRPVATLAPGTNGFIRATLRGLAHSGGHEEHPRENHPFRLTALSDGRLTLYDPASHRMLDLEAFGSLNAAAFATLLIAPEQSK
jgi:putative photosynthetic complex assembly protein